MKLPRGMKDFDYVTFLKIEYIRQKFIETCNIFGFKLMEPSPLESISTLEIKSGTSIKDEIYFFTDKGNREIGLRFDFTVGLTRYVSSQKSMKLPIKVSSFGGVWRYDEPQKNRYRFFYQWDIEIYGIPNIEHDIEIIEFVSRFFYNLDMHDIMIHISNRKLIQSYITTILDYHDDSSITDMLRAIDKIKKKNKTEIISEYIKKGYIRSQLEQLLQFANITGTPDEILTKSPIIDKLDGWNELKKLFVLLKKREIHNILINLGIARGLDYYSDIVFEAFTKSSNDALVGGGRYDIMLHAFGRKEIGATGAAGGVERIASFLGKQSYPGSKQFNRLFIASVNDKMHIHALHIASKLRKKKIPVDVPLTSKPFKKQMKDASNYKFVAIIATKEFELGLIILKNMISGDEKQMPFDNIVDNLEFNS